jgi:hypothetical protein
VREHCCADGGNRISQFIDENVAAMFRDRTKVGAHYRIATEVKRIRGRCAGSHKIHGAHGAHFLYSIHRADASVVVPHAAVRGAEG